MQKTMIEGWPKSGLVAFLDGIYAGWVTHPTEFTEDKTAVVTVELKDDDASRWAKKLATEDDFCLLIIKSVGGNGSVNCSGDGQVMEWKQAPHVFVWSGKLETR